MRSDNHPHMTPPTFLKLLAMQLSMMVSGIVLVDVWSGPLPSTPLTNMSVIAIALGATLLSMGVVLWMYRQSWEWLSHAKRDLRWYSSLLSRLRLWQVVVVGAMAGISEEWLFRAGLQQGLTHWVPEWAAIGLASVVFALAHAISRVYFVATLVIGVLLGAVYAATDSLLLVILWHSLYDMVLLAIVMRYPHWLRLAQPDAPDSSG